MQRRAAVIVFLSALALIARGQFNLSDPAFVGQQGGQQGSYVWDADATNWLNGQGIVATANGADVNSRVSTNINRLVLDAKTNGWWARCDIIYPFIQPYGKWPSTTNNLKYASYTSNAYNCVLTGSATTNTQGIVFAAAGYFKTGYKPSVVRNGGASGVTPTNCHIFIYTTASTPSSGWVAGCNSGANDYLGIWFNAGYTWLTYAMDSSANYPDANYGYSVGGIVCTRTNADLTTLHQGTNTWNHSVTLTQTNYPASEIYVGGRSYQDGISSQFTGTIAGFTVGASIPTNVASVFLADWARYELGMGRRGW